jgi:hypothetical protein
VSWIDISHATNHGGEYHAYLDTLALGQADPGLLLSNDENVALTGCELVVKSVLDVDDVETTIVALSVSDDTNTAHVTTTSHHSNGASVELDEVRDLAGCKVNLDGVVDLDGWVWVADPVLFISIPFAYHHTLVQRLIDAVA